jgi:ABC-type glycerol-3-phosphate transport system substrate-binding protein
VTESTITRRNFQRTLVGTALLASGTSGCLGLAGCSPNDQTHPTNPVTTENKSPKVSSVPLRIWIVGSVRQPETIIRQWNANSEQPIDIRSLSTDELLAQDKCPADLLLYPSRLIGELQKRRWIVNLPSGLSKLAKPDPNSETTDGVLPTAPPGLIATSSYDGTMYGLPLGYSMINLIGSNAIKSNDLTWQQLYQSLSAIERLPLTFDDRRVDRNALIDRFLSIAVGNTNSNAKYGVLFDIRTLNARLKDSEFLFAGELLHTLACQVDAIDSVIGSHSAAWQWINRTQQAGFALLSPSHLDADDNQLDSAQPISLTGHKAISDGSGIIASVTSQCQQTSQATQFLQWIYQPRSLEALRGQIAGMISTSVRGRTLADRVMAANGSALQEDNLISEPRMPGTELYRAALAEHLLEILRGNAKCPEALTAANEAWNKITKEKIKNAKTEYERSLGLSI